MNRTFSLALRWGLALLVLALLGFFVSRALQARRDTQALAAAPKPVAVLELLESDRVRLSNQTLSRSLDFSGTVRAVRSAVVKARIPGEVRMIAVREGEAVRAGQVVVEQDASDADWRLKQAEQQTQAARAQWDVTQRTLANNRALLAQGFISSTALASSVSGEAAAQATVLAAQAAVELARKTRSDARLLAPLSGTVSQRLVQVGERVNVDARLLEIVDLSQLEVEAALPADAVALLKPGSRAKLQVDGISGDIDARVARINPSTQAGSRSVLVYLTLAPHAALRQGLFARGNIEIETRVAPALPASSVRSDRAEPYVLALEDGKLVARKVSTGLRALIEGTEWVEITSPWPADKAVLAGTAGAAAEGMAWRAAAPAKALPAALPAVQPAAQPASQPAVAR